MLRKLGLLTFIIILLVLPLTSSLNEQVIPCGGDSELIIGCLGDSELFFMGQDFISPAIILNSPGNNTQDTDGTVRFIFTPTDGSQISNCSLIYQGGIYTTSTSIIKGASNTIEVTGISSGHSLFRDDLQWSINCTDEFGNTGSSEIRNLDTRFDELGRGGGGMSAISECIEDKDCKTGEHCWKNKCVKLFDIKIIRADSPIEPEEFFDFTYLIKGMADIKGDVIIDFWLEKDGKKASSGSDTIYLGSFEEKIETTSIFLPVDTPTGTYDFYVEINYGEYKAKAHRVVQIGYGIPLILDINLLDLTPITSQDLFEFSTILSFNKDAPTFLHLEERIKRGNKIVWKKEKDLEITRSKTITEKIGRLKPGNYEIELIGYYGENKTLRLSQSFSIKATPKDFELYIIPALIGFAIFVLCFIFYLERKKIKAGIIKEEKWIKRHKILISVLIIFIILGVIIYYLNSAGIISLPIKEFFINILSWFKNNALPWFRGNIIPWFKENILPLFSPKNQYFYYIIGSIISLIVLIIIIIIYRRRHVIKRTKHRKNKKRRAKKFYKKT